MAMCYRTFVMKASFGRVWSVRSGGSEPARDHDGVGSVGGMLNGLPSSRAGSLPQGFSGVFRSDARLRRSVGAGLLAKAVGQLEGMLNGLPSSRASPHSGCRYTPERLVMGAKKTPLNERRSCTSPDSVRFTAPCQPLDWLRGQQPAWPVPQGSLACQSLAADPVAGPRWCRPIPGQHAQGYR
ncbi:hypothetical protein SAMN04488697_107243 [Pseudomonas sp. 43mfcvi1.1]|nr:hypothetical protein ATJ40_107243 [Pseudomonas sp. 43mfcvi1.1]SSB97337.1 hypothetical protein SAMN04488697_107243 [Pseudomonas sp. 43mfcvi1.1]